MSVVCGVLGRDRRGHRLDLEIATEKRLLRALAGFGSALRGLAASRRLPALFAEDLPRLGLQPVLGLLRGLFAGASVEGSRLAPNHQANRRYYGRRIWPEDILFGRKVKGVPAEVRALQKALG